MHQEVPLSMFSDFIPSPSLFLETTGNALLTLVQESVLKTTSSYLQRKAPQILYVGAGLSFLAMLATLVSKVVFAVFCAIGAAVCFRLTLWAFQERERMQARETSTAKENLDRQIASAAECERENKRLNEINKELQEKNQGLEASNKKLSEEMGLYEQRCNQSLADCEALAKVQEEMDKEIEKLKKRIFGEK